MKNPLLLIAVPDQANTLERLPVSPKQALLAHLCT